MAVGYSFFWSLLTCDSGTRTHFSNRLHKILDETLTNAPEMGAGGSAAGKAYPDWTADDVESGERHSCIVVWSRDSNASRRNRNVGGSLQAVRDTHTSRDET